MHPLHVLLDVWFLTMGEVRWEVYRGCKREVEVVLTDFVQVAVP